MGGMPWFQHSKNFRNQPHCAMALCHKEGLRLYGFWVILHEIYAQEWEDPGKNLEISQKYLQREAHISQKNLRLFLEFFENQGALTYQIQGDGVSISIPNFLEIAAAYQKKKNRSQPEDDRSITGQSPPEKRRSLIDKTKEKTPAVGSAVSEEPLTKPLSNPKPDTKPPLIKDEDNGAGDSGANQVPNGEEDEYLKFREYCNGHGVQLKETVQKEVTF